MGFAKYHEDNIKLYDERMYYRNENSYSNVQSIYIINKDEEKYKVYCPFCRKGFKTYNKLIEHVINDHGGVHDFIYLNNRKIIDNEQSVDQIYSLILYSFRSSSKEISIVDNFGKTYSFWTQDEKYEYDLKGILGNELYSEILIKNIEKPVKIKRRYDINSVSIDGISMQKYVSVLFDDQISDAVLSPSEYLIYLKMLINEKEETTSFIEFINQLQLPLTRDLQELYLYYFLDTDNLSFVGQEESKNLYIVLKSVLSGNYSEAEKQIQYIEDSNDKNGIFAILYMLTNDYLGAEYNIKKYNPYGLIGFLFNVIRYYSYGKNKDQVLRTELEELCIFSKYPLIHALIEINDSIKENGVLSRDSYLLLRELTPNAAVLYCNGIEDEASRNKLIRSAEKIHKGSLLLKNYAFENEYDWLNKKIYVSDGDLYRKAVIRQNEKKNHIFSDAFIEDFPYDDQIKITPLGGECEVGASCFVISYKGYNVMLDCGINITKHGSDVYPLLDNWNKSIDAIIVSHAHVDHSGGIPKAHAMWPNANIYATAPTKVLMNYLFYDLAKINNGIVDDYEIENILIEKEAVISSIEAISTVDYKKWVEVSNRFKFRLHPAGHIVGAAMIELCIDDKVILYTGDYCNYNQFFSSGYKVLDLPKKVDYLISELTYIKKRKVDWNKQYEELKKAILDSIKNHKAVLLPSSSIGRSHELICIIGEMKLSGELSDDIHLFIGGMAVLSTTQIIPLMNKHYEEVIGLFEEFDGITYPDGNSIVIASSASMGKRSASYKISRYWENNYIKHTIIGNGSLDEESEINSISINSSGYLKNISLPSHTDLEGIIQLLENISPKVVSFIHRGKCINDEYDGFVSECKGRFANDILIRDLNANQSEAVFDMYEWLTEGENTNG